MYVMLILPLYPHASKGSNRPSAQLTQGSAGPHQGNSKGDGVTGQALFTGHIIESDRVGSSLGEWLWVALGGALCLVYGLIPGEMRPCSLS